MRSRKNVPGDSRTSASASAYSSRMHSFIKSRVSRTRFHITVLVLLALVVVVCFFWAQELHFTASNATNLDFMSNISDCRSDAELKASLRRWSGDAGLRYGFQEPAVNSTVLMLFSSTDAYQYVYKEGMQRGAEGMHPIQPNSSLKRSVLEFTESDWSDSFQRVAAAFLTSPVAESTTWGETRNDNPFFDFFQDHGATFWTIENGTVATPMQLDVVYTYVNPEAASFRRHLEIRKVPFTPVRYNDWQELRYSLRALLAYALQSSSLRQYDNRYKGQQEEDRQTLEALGYRVQPRGDEGRAEGEGVHRGISLIRRVFLVLSDRDQVPAWLNVKAFPMLQIVTHAELFSDPQKEPGILPTMNSNVIESGLHRIPGLSRFFLYVNNDFMFSRQLSFFDLFRPLSPPRQQLYTLRHLFQETCAGCDPQQQEPARPHLRRRFVHLEPLIHSECADLGWERHYKNDPHRKRKQEVQAHQGFCLNNMRHHLLRGYANLTLSSTVGGSQDAPKTMNVSNVSTPGETLLEMLGQPGWKTAPGFCIPDPNIFHTVRGKGVKSVYYFHVMMKNFDGIQPPFFFPHAPQLMDREVLARLTEGELHYLTKETRLAYEREMHPFSPVDAYGFFAAAMARAATRDAWMQQTLTGMARCMVRKGTAVSGCPEAWRTWLEQVQKSLDSAVKKPLVNFSQMNMPSFSDLGPVYGDTFEVRLQDPNLFGEMGFWWFPEMRPKYPKRRTIESLLNVYRVPHVSVSTFGKHKLKDPRSSMKVFTRLNDQYVSLLLEMFHHLLTKQTYRFYMLYNSLNAKQIAARLYLDGKQKMPLWIGLNDNFETRSIEEKNEQNASFQITLIEATGHARPAPWEK